MDSVLQHLADRFEINGTLGSGAYATVYRAFDKRLEREVALKVLHFDESFDADARLRFEREAKTLCAIAHPNIVQVLSFGAPIAASPYMVSELLRGNSLRELLLSDASFALEEVRRIALEACKGLEFMHQNSIVHRDLKPENMFVCDNGNVKLIDLGLCGFAPGAATGQMSLTCTGMVVGTASYMSPEQVRGEKLDGRSDLYSLGCVMYECLAGQTPFTADDMIALMVQHNSVEPDWQFLVKSAPPQSEHLIQVARTALCKDRARRFQSAKEMFDAIASSSYRSKRQWRASLVSMKVSPLAVIALAASLIAGMVIIQGVVAPKAEDSHRVELPRVSC